MPKVFELRKERATKAGEARTLVEKAVSEQRDNTPEELTQIKACEDRMAALERQIATLERVEAVEADGQRSLGGGIRPGENPLAETRHQYSLLRAYRCLLGLEKGGLESEMNQEIATRTGKPAQGFYIPWNLGSQRTLNAGFAPTGVTASGTGGGSIANILGTELIQLLRNRMVMNRMGSRILNDMSGGTFSLPKQTSGTTVQWVAEGTSPSGSNMVINQVTWTPKTVSAFTDLTRRFILQTNQDAEALAREDLAKQIAVELDRVGLNGSGAGQQPLGILQDPNVTTIALGTNGGEPSWANVVSLEKTVAQANAEFGKLGYITSNAGRGIMKQTPKVTSSTFPIFIWEQDTPGDFTMGAEGVVNGYRAMATEQIPSNLTKGSSSGVCTALIYGNWDSATYAFWSGLDLLIDPYTGSSSGNIRIVALQDCDLQFRYEQSFAKTVDMLES